MKWLNIINFMLCIVIIHLVIKNLDVSYSFNEKFNQVKINVQDNIDPSDELYSFINGPIASNEFTSDKESSNFQSNVVDTNSFYIHENKKLQEEFIYKNELPMNGESENGIIGNSDINNKYSSIKDLLNPIKEQSMSNVNDLRNGIDPPDMNKFL